MKHVTRKELSRFKVVYPKNEKRQKNIAHVLQTIDQAIEKTEALIEKNQQIKAGLMHDLFTRGIGTDGQLRPPREQAPELYHEIPIGWIPKEWNVDFVGALDGFVTSGSRDWAKYYADEGDVFIRIGNLTREHINFRLEKLQHVMPPDNSDGQRTKLQHNDLLVSITADLGIVGVVPSEFANAYINQHIALIRLNDERVNNRFVGHYFSTPRFQKYVAMLNDSGAKAGLNLPVVRGFPVIVPERSEQDYIANRVDAVDGVIQNEKTHLTKLQKQKSGLMHDLLTGKVPVKLDNADELQQPEAASV